MRFIYTLMVTLCCCLMPTFALLAQTTWNGSTDSDWFDVSNWTNGLPTNGNDAIIPANLNGGSSPEITASLTVDFSIENYNTLLNSDALAIAVGGTLSNYNNAIFTSVANIILEGTLENSGVFNNQGNFQISGDGVFRNIIGANFTNSTAVTNFGTINNAGTVVNEGSFQSSFLFTNTGTVNNQAFFGIAQNTFFYNGSTPNEGFIFNSARFEIGGQLENNLGIVSNNGEFIINAGGRFLNEDRVVNNFQMTNSGEFTNNSEFTNNDSFLNEFGSSNFNNNGTAVNENCALITQRSSLPIENITNNGIITKVDNAAAVTETPNSTGVCEPNESATPTVLCHSDLEFDLNEEGVITITATDIDNGSSASYCAISTLTISPTTFDCSTLGEQVVTLTAVDERGVFASCTTTILITNGDTPTLACNDDTNVSLPINCDRLEITPEVVLAGNNDCSTNYVVEIEGLDDNFVGPEHVGQTLVVSITDPIGRNTCWGNIYIEDKSAPLFTNCPDITVLCIDNTDPISVTNGQLPIPTIEECPGYSLEYYDQVFMEDCDFNVLSRIERTWEAIDEQGNRSECTQTITIENISFQKTPLNCPEDFQIECAINGTENISPVVTGYPFVIIEGRKYDLINNELGLCGFGAHYEDERFDLCGAGYKIFRDWIIYEDCDGGNTLTCRQVIKVEDTTPPQIIIPEDLDIMTSTFDCAGVTELPAVDIFDCSAFTVTVETSAGIIEGNGGNVPAPGLPLGENRVTYVAVDECGNENRRDLTINVGDTTPPVVVCDDKLHVSLNQEGFARVMATSFDNGSNDNCEIDKLEVYRMASDCSEQGLPEPFVNFSCCDLANNPVMVVLRVTDKAGNYNECMVEVTVEDKIAPEIICAPDKRILCSDDLTNLSVTGRAASMDNCADVTLDFTDNEQLNQCGIGFVYRTWRATTASGQTISCTQTIEVYNDDIFDGEEDIVWPLDVTRNDCVAAAEPSLTGEPIIRDDECDQIFVSHEDQVFTIVPDACAKIIRTWTVIDWCQYNVNSNTQGRWTYTQIIKFLDDTAPVFNSCQDVEFCNANTACEMAVDLSVDITDNCVDMEDLDLTWEVNAFDDDQRDVSAGYRGRGQNIDNVYPHGTHRITYTATDGCGNESVCSFLFTIKDCKPPTSICISGFSTTLMETGEVEIWVSDLESGSSFDNCSEYSELRFSFSSDVNDTSRRYTCNQLGTNRIQVWATDPSGNQSFCEGFIQIQDNSLVCDFGEASTASLGGLIRDENGETVESVEVHSNGDEAMAMTDSDGSFMLDNLPMHEDYTIVPSRDFNPKNGVTTFDIISIRKHILGNKLLDSPYKMIAADVNNSGSITTADMIQIRQLVLNITTAFPDNPSWRFIRADHEFADPTNPYAEGFPEIYNINDLDTSMESVDFVAIKMGDVNGSAVPNDLVQIDERANEAIAFNLEDQSFVAGESIEVSFSAEDLVNIQGFQFTLAYEVDRLAVQSIDYGVLTAANFNEEFLQEGKLPVSWNNDKNLQEDEKVFTVHFIAQATGKLSEVLSINSSITKAEAYKNTNELVNINIRYKSGINLAKDNFVLEQNQPNPFSEETTIGFHLPQSNLATLTIIDVSGKVLKVYQNTFQKGLNKVTISTADLGARGLLYYRLETEGHVAVKKMIVD